MFRIRYIGVIDIIDLIFPETRIQFGFYINLNRSIAYWCKIYSVVYSEIDKFLLGIKSYSSSRLLSN